MNLNIYKRELVHSGTSVFSSGERMTGTFDFEVLKSHFREGSLIHAFLDDDDIQEITITSANIGFVRTYTKQYKKQ